MATFHPSLLYKATPAAKRLRQPIGIGWCLCRDLSAIVVLLLFTGLAITLTIACITSKSSTCYGYRLLTAWFSTD